MSNFLPGKPVTLIDNKARRYLIFPQEKGRYHVAGGYIDADELLKCDSGSRLRTSKGEIIAAYATTLEEYVLLMPRAATVVPPKDIGFLIQWADIPNGGHVVEAGIGSGGLSLGLLRAVGPEGRLTAFELREDHANRAIKNIKAWHEPLSERLTVHVADIAQGLADLQDVDRVVLDLPAPQAVLDSAAKALKSGGILTAYVPNIRQIDELLQAVMAHPSFADAEVCEVMLRPWVADKLRLRPELRITGHTGFLFRTRRRGRAAPSLHHNDSPVAAVDESNDDEGGKDDE